MTETISIIIEKDNIEKLILDYYKKYFNDENITIKYKIFEEDEYSLGRVVISIKRNIKIGDYEALSENVLSSEEIINVLNNELKNQGYKINYSNFIIDRTNWNGIRATLEKLDVKKKVLGK